MLIKDMNAEHFEIFFFSEYEIKTLDFIFLFQKNLICQNKIFKKCLYLNSSVQRQISQKAA